jgi:membrane-associated protease RseP (regulator of RpoE activity)
MTQQHDPAEDGSLQLGESPDAAQAHEPEASPAPVTRLPLAIGLFVLTVLSTTYVGSLWEGSDSLLGGLSYSAPLMAILLAHEFGHYIAARIHRVPASLPYFVPMPLPPLGTMGAVILMPGAIRSRNALLDIGAAGPLAGMVVALPVLIYGIAMSPTGPEPTVTYLMEGKSLLYMGLLYAIKGPLPEGHDILLSPMAFAGWAGLLVTMINLIPALQLDGGHVAHALLGERHERISRALRRLIFPFAVVVALGYGLPAFLEGKRGDALWSEIGAGGPWLTWGILMHWMARGHTREHPETEDGSTLSPRRRWVARLTLALFVLLFMPAWLREVHPL